MKTARCTGLGRCAGLGVLALLAATPALGEADHSDPAALRSSVAEVLSLATLGMVTVQQQAAQVTRSGADFLVRLPLGGFAEPSDAAVKAVARPLNDGVWNITSMMFPAAGTIGVDRQDIGTARIAYTIAEQTTHARIDPGFVQASSFAATFGGVGLQIDQDDRHSEQRLDRYSVDGALSGETAGRLTFASNSRAENWHLVSHGPDGIETDANARALAGHVTVEGLDRVQGTRLLTATRALFAEAQPAVPTPPPGMSVAQRDALRAVIDAADGLLTRFEADQTVDGIRFAFGPLASGSLGRLHVNMRGDTAAERLAGQMDISVDGLALSGMSAETAAYVPHHVDLKSTMAGMPIGELMAFLRAATEADADPAALQDRLLQLFADPGAQIGIESIAFDSGPLRLTGSARVVPRAGGQISAAVHLSATGVDALIARAQGTPALQQALPMMFMAKGMGRVEGDAMVWDIALGDGPVTINGAPFGAGVPLDQPVPRTR